MTSKRKPLTPEQAACAERLNSIFLEKKANREITQEALGGILGISQPAVGQYLRGIIPLGLQAKVAFAFALGCDVSEIDPDVPFAPPLTPDEQELVDYYRASSGEEQEFLLGAGRMAAGRKSSEK